MSSAVLCLSCAPQPERALSCPQARPRGYSVSVSTLTFPPQQILGLSPETVDYQRAWDLQQTLHHSVVQGERPGAVLFLEHSPVYTAGRRTEPQDLPDDGSEVVAVDRGGKLTWHGPGQLVCYPVVRLAHPAEVRDYVWFLEEVVIRTLADVGLQAVRVDGRSGVWLLAGAGRPQDEKIAAVGLRVTQGVSMHGFALNCSNPLAPFEHIVACGVSDAGTTTISRELGRTLTPAQVLPSVREHFTQMQSHYLAAVSALTYDRTATDNALLEGSSL